MWCWKIEVTQVRLPISISINSLIIGGNLTRFGKLVEKGLKLNINAKFWGYLKKPVRKLRLLYINVKTLKKEISEILFQHISLHIQPSLNHVWGSFDDKIYLRLPETRVVLCLQEKVIESAIF